MKVFTSSRRPILVGRSMPRSRSLSPDQFHLSVSPGEEGGFVVSEGTDCGGCGLT